MIIGTPEYWNGEAGRNWAKSHRLLEAVLEPFARVLLDAADLPSTGMVVDVGCGCGATTFMAAERSPGLHALGVDVSRPMLEVARRRASASDLAVRFEEADAATQQLDEPADRVISRFGVMFFPEPNAAFANLGTWLRPGGRIAMVVWNPMHDNPWAMSLVGIVARHVELEPPPPDGPGPFSLGDEEHMERLLTSAGFAGVGQTPLGIPMRVPGTIDQVFGFLRDRGPVMSALKVAPKAVGDALLLDLHTFAAEAHDGGGVTLPARARLVTATAIG